MIALITLTTSGTARSGSLETLLMPGPVSQAHAKTEADCDACHDKKDREHQAHLCLACHKDVAADLAAGAGFHGHLRDAQSAQCQACHSEHHGRQFDIVRLNRQNFDHESSGFALRGAHQGLRCEDCHHPGQALRKAPTECIGCHRADDPHRGNLGTQCQNCHEVSTWHDVRFDHDRTEFPLHDKHQSVPCAACHAAEHYKGTPTQCAACHTPDDVHKGTRGTKCADCHNTTGWKSARFDHARETGFALVGRHARLDCADCHRSGDLKAPIPKVCSGCHAGADAHAGRFGASCADCHGNEVWRIERYDHEGRHHFALDGSHAKLGCHACHTAVATEHKLPQDCAGCHRADDVHGGALGAHCETCHGTSSWSARQRFDHDLTAFPLVGLHVVVTCAQCHATQRFKDAPTRCHACHAAKDVHKGGLGTDCAACHSPNGWNLWEFDHAARTHFPLTVAHMPLRCAQCHSRPAGEVKLSTQCIACHQSDDVHAGQFGRQCERCHNTLTFRGGRAN